MIGSLSIGLVLQPDNIVYLCCKTVGSLAVKYGSDEATFTQHNKSQICYIFVHSVVNSTKRLYKKCYSWTYFNCSRKPKCFSKTCSEQVPKKTKTEVTVNLQ
jgi:hypothetical protein